MKHAFAPLLTLFSAALISGSAISLATDTDKTPASKTTSSSLSGEYTVRAAPPATALQTLAVKPNADGSIEFGVSVWFESGQNCGVIGTAKSTGPGQWRYEDSLTSDIEDDRCAIDITQAKDGKITLNADAAAQCKSACGGGAAISDITFPDGSQTSSAPAGDVLSDPEKFFNPQVPSP
jgi:hypothetical protein